MILAPKSGDWKIERLPKNPDAIDLSAIHREKTRAEHYARVARARDGETSHG